MEDISKATALEIGKLKRPVVTAYQIGLIVFALYTAKTYQGEKLKYIKRDFPQRIDYTRTIKKLVDSGVLQNSPELPNHEVFAVLSQSAASAEEVACCIDPFCYVSHLSAMEHHGFTDRLPKVLFLTAPKTARWTKLAQEKMENDLGNSIKQYLETRLPSLRRLRLPKIARKTVSVQTSAHYDSGSYVSMQGKALRVSSIGRTFLDMIRAPDLCGGIYHVLDVFAQNAPRYLRLILDEVQQHGSQIDKIRVGYILEERLGLADPVIETWRSNVQRGGSRKLVAENPYMPRFSEKWALSINIEERTE
jgi:predicted transcriptional regulator of viral defense system